MKLWAALLVALVGLAQAREQVFRNGQLLRGSAGEDGPAKNAVAGARNLFAKTKNLAGKAATATGNAVGKAATATANAVKNAPANLNKAVDNAADAIDDGIAKTGKAISAGADKAKAAAAAAKKAGKKVIRDGANAVANAAAE